MRDPIRLIWIVNKIAFWLLTAENLLQPSRQAGRVVVMLVLDELTVFFTSELEANSMGLNLFVVRPTHC